MQLLFPTLLALDASQNHQDDVDCVADDMDDGCKERNFWCTQRPDSLNQKLMIFAVILLYLSKVVPDQFYTFVRKVADDDSGISKLTSLRQLVWDQDEDTFLMKIGFRM